MAASPSPLPLPAQSPTPQTPVSDLLATLANAVPGLDAEYTSAIARSTANPDDAVTAGQATQSFQVSSQSVQQLQQESNANQQAVWKTATAPQQQALQSAGYKPPSTGTSLFGSIAHDLGQGLHDTLNAAGAPLRAVQHAERTLLAPPRSGAQAGFWGNLLSPQDWADAWDQTSSGKSYIQPRVQQQVQQQYGDQIYSLALKMARGTTLTQIMAQTPAAQQAATAQLIQSDPKFQQALQQLNNGHLSVGRMLVGDHFLTAHPELGSLISGGTDALLDWFSDPVNMGAQAYAGVKASRYLVRTASDVDHLYQTNGAVRAGMEAIASRLAGPNPTSAVMNAFPKLTPLVAGMVQSGITTADDVARYFGDMKNLNVLIDHAPGELPGITGGTFLPSLSTVGQLRLAVKTSLQHAIDFAADGPVTAAEHLSPGDIDSSPLNGPGAISRLATRPLTSLGSFARKLTTLTPPKTFDAASPNWLKNLSDIALMALPRARVNDTLDEFARAADLGQKKTLYVNLMKEIYERTGLADTTAGRGYITQFMEDDPAKNPASLQKYGVGTTDRFLLDSGETNVGLLERHLTDEWQVPSYKELYSQSKKLGVTHMLMGGPNSHMVDTLMQNIWKPLTLARIGFALRVSGEEAFGFLLRSGPTALIRTRAALSALKDSGRTEDDPGNPLFSPIASLWDKLTGHLPQAAVDTIETPAQLAAGVMGDATKRALSGVAGLGSLDYKTAIERGYNGNVFDDGFAEYVSAGHDRGLGYLDGDITAKRMNVFDHGRSVPAVLRKTGSFTDYSKDSDPLGLFAAMWHGQLAELASSAWGRRALINQNSNLYTRIQDVADEIDKYPEMAARSPRYHGTPDGRLVSTGEVTQREATENWAARIIDNVDMLTRSGIGATPIELTPGTTLAQHLIENGRPPSLPVLESTPDHLKPSIVKGPEMVPTLRGGTGFFTKSITRMFDVISRQINWISRKPMFLHNFTVSLNTLDETLAPQLRRLGMAESDIERRVVESARDRAVDLTVPYIHNPELRSQFAVITRNLMPFWFAQEQFYKRWARTAVYSPWSFRQAQLISQGVAHSGFVHTDPTTGQKYFVYPGASAVQDVLTRTLSAFGYKSWLPIQAGLRGLVNQASPGLERLGLPSYGPLIVVPLKLVEDRFPELKSPISSIVGQQSTDSTFAQSVFPSTVTRIWDDIHANQNNSAQYASAMMQAIQYLEATGHGIGTVATTNLGNFPGTGAPTISHSSLHPGDYITNAQGTQYVYQPDDTWKSNSAAALASYMHTVENWTRIFMVTRTIFGFSAPASPENQFDPSHLNEDLQGLLKALPLDQALSTFMTEHPNATAYTVFQTKTAAGDPLPATTDAMNFLSANSQFMDAHTLSGAYFIPAVDTSGKFSLNAYEQQLSEQLRTHKAPAQFWQEISYNQAASVYFAAEDRKNALLNNPGAAGATTSQIEQSWTAASQQFMLANPLFAQQLGTTPSTPGGLTQGSTTYTRAALLSDLVSALNDPLTPATQQTSDIRTLVNSYISYQTQVAPYGQPGAPTLSSVQRFQMELSYATQVSSWVAEHPDIQALYNRLVRPTLSAVLDQEASGGTTTA